MLTPRREPKTNENIPSVGLVGAAASVSHDCLSVEREVVVVEAVKVVVVAASAVAGSNSSINGNIL